MIKKALLTSAMLLMVAPAHSQEQESSVPEGYLRISVGQSDLSIGAVDETESITLSAGVHITENVAFEATYVNLGEADYATPANSVSSIEFTGFNFSVVGIYPVSQLFDVFGKAGGFAWDASLGGVDSEGVVKDDGVGLAFSVGAVANITESLGVVLEYQRFDLDSLDGENISLGLKFSFR